MFFLPLLGMAAIAIAAPTFGPKPWGFFTNNTILTTSGNYSVTYPRYVELMDGTILATTAYSGPHPPYFPIFGSRDGGASWQHISDLTDQVNGVGFGSQPAITQLPFPLGGYPAGTILAGGNSAGPNFTRIDLYASIDGAKSWQFVSHVAEGGKANTTNGATPVWEPYFLWVSMEVRVLTVLDPTRISWWHITLTNVTRFTDKSSAIKCPTTSRTGAQSLTMSPTTSTLPVPA
jgi:hypothetical protein